MVSTNIMELPLHRRIARTAMCGAMALSIGLGGAIATATPAFASDNGGTLTITADTNKKTDKSTWKAVQLYSADVFDAGDGTTLFKDVTVKNSSIASIIEQLKKDTTPRGSEQKSYADIWNAGQQGSQKMSEPEFVAACIELDGGTNMANNVRVAANSASMRLAAAAQEADGTALAPGTAQALDSGYWLVVETPTTGESNKATSPIFVPIKDDDVTVTKKAEIETADKNIVGPATVDNAKHTDVNIGDEVKYELPATYTDMTSFTTYKFAFHDTMTNLEMSADQVNAVKVYVNDVDKTSSFDISFSNGKLLVKTDDLKAIVTDMGGDIVRGTVKVEYGATLMPTAVIGEQSTANKNDVELEFSNNPYDSSETDKTPVVTTEVKTYGLQLDKYDDVDQAPLAGAHFELKKGTETLKFTQVEGTYKYDPSGTVTDLVTNADGTINVVGLDEGEYVWHETAAPAGYKTVGDTTVKFDVKIAADGSYEVTKSVSGSDLKSAEVTDTNGVFEVGVVDEKGIDMPFTGQQGMMMLTVVGAGVIAFSFAEVLRRRRAEDAE